MYGFDLLGKLAPKITDFRFLLIGHSTELDNIRPHFLGGLAPVLLELHPPQYEWNTPHSSEMYLLNGNKHCQTSPRRIHDYKTDSLFLGHIFSTIREVRSDLGISSLRQGREEIPISTPSKAPGPDRDGDLGEQSGFPIINLDTS